MKANVKTGIAFSCVAVASFIAGFLLSGPIISHELAAGDISRAKIYTKSVVNVDSDNLQERLLSDEAYREAANSRAEILKSHAHQLSELIDNTGKTVGANEQFASVVNCMNNQKKSIENACAAIDSYTEKLAELSSGNKVKDFEQAYNNAMLSALILTQNSNLSLVFDNVAVNYGKEASDYKEIHDLWASWMSWMAIDKFMIGQSEMAKQIMDYSFENNLDVESKVQNIVGAESPETISAAFENQNKALGFFNNAAFDFGIRILNTDQLGVDVSIISAQQKMSSEQKMSAQQKMSSEQKMSSQQKVGN